VFGGGEVVVGIFYPR